MGPANEAGLAIAAREELKEHDLRILQAELGFASAILFGEFLKPHGELHLGGIRLPGDERDVHDAAGEGPGIHMNFPRPDDVHTLIGGAEKGVGRDGIKKILEERIGEVLVRRKIRLIDVRDGGFADGQPTDNRDDRCSVNPWLGLAQREDRVTMRDGGHSDKVVTVEFVGEVQPETWFVVDGTGYFRDETADGKVLRRHLGDMLDVLERGEELIALGCVSPAIRDPAVGDVLVHSGKDEFLIILVQQQTVVEGGIALKRQGDHIPAAAFETGSIAPSAREAGEFPERLVAGHGLAHGALTGHHLMQFLIVEHRVAAFLVWFLFLRSGSWFW